MFFEVDDSHTLARIMSRVAECLDASVGKGFMQEADARLVDQYKSIILDCI